MAGRPSRNEGGRSNDRGRWNENSGRNRWGSTTRSSSAQRTDRLVGARGGQIRSCSSTGGTRAPFYQQTGNHQVRWENIFDTILMKYNGAANFLSVRSEFPESMSNNDISAWFRSQNNNFRLVESERGEISRIHVFKRNLGICFRYKANKICSDSQCGYLHVCPYFIANCCRGECDRAHDFLSHSTRMILERNKLGRYGENDITLVVRFSVPIVCSHYNKQTCKYGNRCSSFHICADFVRGSCNEECPKEHSLDCCKGLVKSFNLDEKPDFFVYRLMIVPSIPHFAFTTSRDTVSGAKQKPKYNKEVTRYSEAELRAKIESEIKEKIEVEMKEKIAAEMEKDMRRQQSMSPRVTAVPGKPEIGYATSMMQQQVQMQLSQKQMQMQDNIQKQFQMQQQELMFKQMQEMITKQMQEQLLKQQQEMMFKHMEKNIQQTMDEKLSQLSSASANPSSSGHKQYAEKKSGNKRGKEQKNKPAKDKSGKLPDVKVTPGNYAQQTFREPDDSDEDSDEDSDNDIECTPSLLTLKDPLHNNKTPIDCLCELSAIDKTCPKKYDCPRLHYKYPYLWQIFMNKKWLDLKADNAYIEQIYCSPDRCSYAAPIITIPRELQGYDIEIDFTNMEAEAVDAQENKTFVLDVRRLSTRSWADPTVVSSLENLTEWTWFMLNNETKEWLKFSEISGAPSNKLIEEKFLSGSPRIRYKRRHEEDPYRIEFSSMLHSNEVNGTESLVRRRPIFAAKQSMYY